MLTALRKEVYQAAEGLTLRSPLSLRRAREADALFVCNLPQLTGDEGVSRFTQRLACRGWHIRRLGGRLLLDAPIPLPEAPETPVSAAAETACCLSLLRRHPSGLTDRAALRSLAKAAEEGPAAVEALCRAWHRQWAVLLRQGQPLPGGLLPYLEFAAKEAFE